MDVEDLSSHGRFHAALFMPPEDPDDVIYMVGYDTGAIDLARRLAGIEPEVVWHPFTTEAHSVRTATLDGLSAYITPEGDGYAWWIESARSGAVLASDTATEPDDARVAVEGALAAQASLAPLAPIVERILTDNPHVSHREAVSLAKKAQRIAWQAVGA